MVWLRLVFPACAGVILTDTRSRRLRSSVPRMCGGDPGDMHAALDYAKCSPHVRGNPAIKSDSPKQALCFPYVRGDFCQSDRFCCVFPI